MIERFKNNDAVPVYRRFRERGRLMPDGLTLVSSWVEPALDLRYRVMETDDRSLLDQWMTGWSDLIDFEVRPVMASSGAQAAVRRD